MRKIHKKHQIEKLKKKINNSVFLKFLPKLREKIISLQKIFKNRGFDFFKLQFFLKFLNRAIRHFLIFAGFSCFFVVTADAFFSNPSIEILDRRIKIEVDGEQIFIEISEQIKNTSFSTEIQFFHPIDSSSEVKNFFVDSEGWDFDIFAEKTATEIIFDEATSARDSNFFRLATLPKFKIFRSAKIPISSGKSKFLKFAFTKKIDFVDDFYFSEIFSDKIPAKKFEFSLLIPAKNGEIQHIFTTLPHGGLSEKNLFGATNFFARENFAPNQNIRFFWSFAKSPELRFSTNNFEYRGYFGGKTPEKLAKKIQKFTFLIDQSGSATGQIWNRTVEWLNEILDKIGEDKFVRIVFYSDRARWFFPQNSSRKISDGEFYKNSFDFRRQLAKFLRFSRPMGKTNATDALRVAESNLPESGEHAIVWITDASEFPIEIWNDFPSRIVVLNFSNANLKLKKVSDLEFLARESGGFFQKLFRFPANLVEIEDFWKKWENWSEEKFREEAKPNAEDLEMVPRRLPANTDDFSQFFVGRTEGAGSPYASAARFLPRVWAGGRIAEILRKCFENPLEQFEDSSKTASKNYQICQDDKLDAILSIGRRFGIKTDFFDENTHRNKLRASLKNASLRQIWRVIAELESPNRHFSSSDIRFSGDRPFFRKFDGTWQSFDFYDRANPEFLIKISPFSRAQKNLFLKFPKIFANPFGISEKVDFCVGERCIQIRPGTRTKPRRSDTLFFRDFSAGHWANSSILRAVDENWLEPDNSDPRKILNRGEFLKIVGKKFFSDEIEKFTPTVKSENSDNEQIRFSDISKNSKFFKQIYFFASRGVIRGFPDGKFHSEQNLTRAEAVKILLASQKIAPAPANEPAIFADATGWEKPWVNVAVKLGIAHGFQDGFRPAKKLSLGEAVKMLERVSR